MIYFVIHLVLFKICKKFFFVYNLRIIVYIITVIISIFAKLN